MKKGQEVAHYRQIDSKGSRGMKLCVIGKCRKMKRRKWTLKHIPNSSCFASKRKIPLTDSEDEFNCEAQELKYNRKLEKKAKRQLECAFFIFIMTFFMFYCLLVLNMHFLDNPKVSFYHSLNYFLGLNSDRMSLSLQMALQHANFCVVCVLLPSFGLFSTFLLVCSACYNFILWIVYMFFKLVNRNDKFEHWYISSDESDGNNEDSDNGGELDISEKCESKSANTPDSRSN